MSETGQLSDKETKWIETCVGQSDSIQPALDVDALKQRLLKEARQTIDSKVGEIKLGEDFQVDTLSDFLKRRITMSSIGESPDEEFDTGHDTHKMTGMDPKAFQQLINAQSIIVKEVETLRGAKDKATKKRLFTDKEIAEAIWAPLMRRKLIPENAIPDRYSEVARTFSGASAEYENRLASYTQSLNDNYKAMAMLGFGKDIVDGLSGLAGGLVVDISMLDPNAIKNPYEAVTIIKGVQLGVTTLANTAQELLKSGGKLDKTNVQTICKDLAKSVPALINAGFASESWNEANLGKAIAYGVAPLFSLPAIMIKIKDGNFSDLLDDVADMVQAGCNAYTYTEKSEGKTDLGPGNAGVTQWNDVGVAMADGIKALKNTVVLVKSKDEMDAVDLLNLLQDYLKGTVDAGSQWKFDEYKSEIELEGAKRDVSRDEGVSLNDVTDTEGKEFKSDSNKVQTGSEDAPSNTDLQMAYGILDLEAQALRDGIKDVGGWAAMNKLLKEVRAKGTAALIKIEKDNPAYKTLEKIAKINDEGTKERAKMAQLVKNVQINGTAALKEIGIDHPAYQSLLKLAELTDRNNKQIIEEAQKDFDKDLEDDNREFRDLLNRSESGDGEEDVEKVETLIMALKRDQMILDLSLSLATMPGQVLAAFLPQAGAAVAAVELIKNIRKAIEHFKAYAEWQENTRDARSAMSIQVEAMTNRMDLSRSQGTNQVITALENAARIVGGAFACAGPFAPTGHVISATVSAVSSLRTMVTKFYTEKKLRDSWALYQSALDNPDDRKVIRKAIRTNPTLSKYVIAWGAEVDGNPVAKSAMQKCGLTEDVLSSKNTNVQKVTAFLEALYPEDPVLLRPVGFPEDWYPGPVEFTSASLAAFAGAAQTSASPKLKVGAAKPLIIGLTRLEAAVVAAQNARTVWNDAQPQDEKQAQMVLAKALQDGLQASLILLNTLKAFKPVAENGKAHDEFATYARQLVPTARQFAEKFKREGDALEELAAA